MNVKSLASAISLLLVSAFASFAQKSDCSQTDYKCRLDEQMERIRKDPKDIEAYYDVGLLFMESGNFKGAVTTFDMYIGAPVENRQNLADAYNNRAVSLRKLGRNQDAIRGFQKAIELKSDDPKFVTNLGNAYRDAKEFDLAIKQYDKAIRVDPRFVPAYLSRGLLYSMTGKNDEAIADLDAVIKIDSNEPEAYYNRGTIRFQQKEFRKALPDFDKYIELRPANSRALRDGYINRSICRYYTGATSGAIEDATKAIELDPTNARSYQLRSMLYREQKSNDLAEADEKKARELSGSKAQ